MTVYVECNIGSDCVTHRSGQGLLYLSMEPLSTGELQNNIVVKWALLGMSSHPWNRLFNMFLALNTSYELWAFRVSILTLSMVTINRCYLTLQFLLLRWRRRWTACPIALFVRYMHGMNSVRHMSIQIWIWIIYLQNHCLRVFQICYWVVFFQGWNLFHLKWL